MRLVDLMYLFELQAAVRSSYILSITVYSSLVVSGGSHVGGCTGCVIAYFLVGRNIVELE